jgi:hypothetical protein
MKVVGYERLEIKLKPVERKVAELKELLAV